MILTSISSTSISSTACSRLVVARAAESGPPASQGRGGERTQAAGDLIVDTTAENAAQQGNGALQAQQSTFTDATDQRETDHPVDRLQRTTPER